MDTLTDTEWTWARTEYRRLRREARLLTAQPCPGEALIHADEYQDFQAFLEEKGATPENLFAPVYGPKLGHYLGALNPHYDL